MKRQLSRSRRIKVGNAPAVVVVLAWPPSWRSEPTGAAAVAGSRSALQDGGGAILCGRSIAAVTAGWMEGGTCG